METVEEGETNFENETQLENLESTKIQNGVLESTEQPLIVEDKKETEEQKPQIDEVKTEKILQDDCILSPPTFSQPTNSTNSEEQSFPKELNPIYNKVENNPSDTTVPISSTSNSVMQETTVREMFFLLSFFKNTNSSFIFL